MPASRFVQAALGRSVEINFFWSLEQVSVLTGADSLRADGARPDTEASRYAGAIASGVIGLLLYLNVLVLPARVIGPMVAVWYALARRGQPLRLKEVI
jgi:hypothetical protein